MPHVIEVIVKGDHLEGLAHPARSLSGIVEMIWNAVDAEATEVRVSLTQNELEGVASVEIADNGHGMTPTDAERDFETLGGSWKLHAERSKNGQRLLHGRHGQGRWRALAVGSLVRWISVAETQGDRVRTTITAQRSALTRFNIEDPEATDEPTGTRVVIENVDAEPASALLADDAQDVLTTRLALYLERYPNVEMSYRDAALDPSKLQSNRETYDIPVPTDEHGTATLTVIEWNRRVARELLLCDENGMTLASEHPGIQALGFEFTSYLSWAGFREHEHELAAADLHPVTGLIIENAREKLREHFRARAAERQAGVLEQWKSEDVYPYKGEATSDIEKVERNLFDVVAANAARAVNSSPDRIGKKFSLRLLREAIEQSPSALRRVLHEVLELPEARLRELDELLDRISLTAIIALGRIVANRLDFIAGLKELVFDPKTKKQVLERRQLHRILANEAWIFGDQYTLAVDDEGLKAVLEQHIKLLGRDKTAEDLEEVVLENGTGAIIDLLLAATIPLPTQEHEHLVVELKRPGLTLGHEELTQIERYADAVARDPRFDKVSVRWNFWLVGTKMNEFVGGRASQPHLPPGVVSQPLDGRVTIRVKTWSQILDDCEQRLKFVREKLDYRSSRDAGVEYLRQRHEQYLPEALRAPSPRSHPGPQPRV